MKFNLGWLDEAIEIDYFTKSMSRQGYKPTHIVLHGTAGGSNAQGIANYFATSPVQASAHFIIGQDGAIVQGISVDDAAWANGILDHPRLPFPTNVNANLYTISIEHVKTATDNSNALTDAQKTASFQLIQALCQQYGIPARPGDAGSGIVSHADFDSVSRARCPGPYPWDELWSFLKGANTVNIPHGWQYDQQAKELTAPNKIKVTGALCEYILNYAQWDANNQPEAPAEQRATQLELSNAGLGGGIRQLFTGTNGYPSLLEWTKDRGVFVAYAGRELHAVEQLVVQLQKQIAQNSLPANISQAVQAINAIGVMAEQLKSDGDTISTAVKNALTALGK